jgi:hypothetical protein
MRGNPVRRITVGERRARLAIRQHLAPAAWGADGTEVARDLVGLHATDPATVYLAACARLHDGRVETLEQSLYDQRSLVRMLGMRRTMFVLPLDLVPVVQAACTRAIAVNERRRTLQLLAEGGIAQDPAGWLERAESLALEALARRGPSTASELDVVEVDLDGAPGPGLVLADDVETVASPGPWVALLPTLDPTTMGWTHRDWYLGKHRPALFDTSGNAGLTGPEYEMLGPELPSRARHG